MTDTSAAPILEESAISADRQSRSRSPKASNPQNLKFERADWTLFRSISTLPQKAGVPARRLRRLVLKELVDNALDAGGEVEVGELEGGGYYIQDDGPGIEPAEIATLFSIDRPMVSSKLLRLPTRGALGNGLRVVTGAVLASSGRLKIYTRDRRIDPAMTAASMRTPTLVRMGNVPLMMRIRTNPNRHPMVHLRKNRKMSRRRRDRKPNLPSPRLRRTVLTPRR